MAGGAVLREQLRAGVPGIQILLAVCAGGRQSSQQRDHAWPKEPHLRHSGPPYCPAQAPSKETKCASGFYTWPLFLWQTGPSALAGAASAIGLALTTLSDRLLIF